jgi:hypothetical protein
MSEGAGRWQEARELPAAELLAVAVERLLAESPVELPGPVALERLRTILACAERLEAAQLLAVRDLDRRELYALDAAGSARTWLRRQRGGEDGQVTLARRLADRQVVSTALADARIGLRTASQLCTALESIPADLEDPLVRAVLHDGIGALLRQHTGGTPEDPMAAATVLAQRAADEAVLTACAADTTSDAAAQLEPAFVLLAERLPAAQIGSALRLLLDPLRPDGTDQPEADPYYLELRTLADGDVDLRGLLDPETGRSLAAELERRLDTARATAAARRSGTSAPSPDDEHADADDRVADGVDDADEADDADDPLLRWDRALADANARAARRATGPDGDIGHADRSPDTPRRLISAGRRRHDALRDLLTDARTATARGEPAPAHLTIIATLDAVHGRLGALPAQLVLPDSRATPLRTETLHRLGCHSQLDAVLLDAHGTPVGASSTRRMPNPKERRALRARWGPTCAVDGCSHTRTVPHHVIPWWLSRRTRLPDLIPLCTSCHHDLHEGHRTLRLRDTRHVDDRGWTTTAHAAAA